MLIFRHGKILDGEFIILVALKIDVVVELLKHPWE